MDIDPTTESLITSVKFILGGQLNQTIEFNEFYSREQLVSDLASTNEKVIFSYVKVLREMRGLVCLATPESVAKKIAIATLGEEEYQSLAFEGVPILNETMGELNNMVAGTYRNMLSKRKIHCGLSTPGVFEDQAQLLGLMAKAANFWVLNFKADEFDISVVQIMSADQ